MRPKLQFQFAVKQEAGCVSGSTLLDESKAHMYSSVASKEAETRDADRTLRACQLTVVKTAESMITVSPRSKISDPSLFCSSTTSSKNKSIALPFDGPSIMFI